MPIRFSCDACDKSFSVKDEMAGKKGKCSACGNAMRIPIPGIVEPFSLAKTREPIRIPEAPPTPQRFHAQSAPANVQVVVNGASENGKSVNGLGVAGVIIGIFVMLSCWIPFANIIAAPVMLVGGILSLVGLAVACSGKKSGIGWPITGLSLNVAAFVIMIMVNVAMVGATAVAKARADRENANNPAIEAAAP